MEREENLLAAFSFFGKDGSGYITIDELQQACKDFGLSEIQWEDIFKEIDQDNVDLLSSMSNSHKVDDLVIVHRISIEDILQGAEREMQMIFRHQPLTIFREEELRKFIGIKNIEMNHFVIECGCKSLKCGDIMGHLKIFGRRLEITCKCSADCKEEVDLKW